MPWTFPTYGEWALLWGAIMLTCIAVLLVPNALYQLELMRNLRKYRTQEPVQEEPS